MAVSVTATWVQYVGNASTVTPYATTFRFDDSSWLRVYTTDADGVTELLELGTDYTVTGAGDATGEVTTIVAVPATSTVTIARVTPKTQTLDLEYNDRLPSQLAEDAYDKLTFIAQELAAERPLAFPPQEPSATETELPGAADRVSTVFGFDSDGDPALLELPLPVIPIAPADSGTFVLMSLDGVIQWVQDTSSDYPGGSP